MATERTPRHTLPKAKGPEIWKLGKTIDQISEIPALIRLLVLHYEVLTEAADKIKQANAAGKPQAEEILSSQLENFHSGIRESISPEFLNTLDKQMANYPYITIINPDKSQQVNYLSLSRVLNDIQLFLERRVLSVPSTYPDVLWELRREIAFTANCLERIMGQSKK